LLLINDVLDVYTLQVVVVVVVVVVVMGLEAF
jgi:hypothetical protein